MPLGEHPSADVIAATRGDFGSWRSRSLSALVELWARVVRLRNASRAAAQLAAMNDHMLKDIGISRAEIEHVVRYGRRWD